VTAINEIINTLRASIDSMEVLIMDRDGNKKEFNALALAETTTVLGGKIMDTLGDILRDADAIDEDFEEMTGVMDKARDALLDGNKFKEGITLEDVVFHQWGPTKYAMKQQIKMLNLMGARFEGLL